MHKGTILAAVGALALTAVLPAASASAAAAGRAVPSSITGVSSLPSISCPTAAACVAVGYGGSNDTTGMSVVLNAATGGTTTWSGGLANEQLSAVACHAKATTCLTVADDGVATVAVSTGAMVVTATPKPPAGGIVALGTIACATTKSCYAAGFEGTRPNTQALLVHLSAAGKIIKKTVDTGTGIGTIACPSSTRCLFTDYTSPVDSLQMISSGTISTVATFPTDTYVQQIACYKASVCFALGGNSTAPPDSTNELFPINPTTGAIGAMATMPGFNGDGMACASATKCLVAGFTGAGQTAKAAYVTVTSGVPGTPVAVAGPFLNDVACATASRCYATGWNTSDKPMIKKV